MSAWDQHKTKVTKGSLRVGEDDTSEYFELVVGRSHSAQEQTILQELARDYDPGSTWERQFGFPKKTYRIARWRHRDGSEKLCWRLAKEIDSRNVFERNEAALSTTPLGPEDAARYLNLDRDRWEYGFPQRSAGMANARVSGPLESELIQFIEGGGQGRTELSGRTHELVVVLDRDRKKCLLWRTESREVRPVAEELAQNNASRWDWITWETLGNPGELYRRGDRMRRLGLYKLSYDRLRRAADGDATWAAASVSADGTELGGGRVKVYVLKGVDYRDHERLVHTFLPGFAIDSSGKIREPAQNREGTIDLARVLTNSANSSLSLVMPYNYDDNRSGCRTLGTDVANLPGYVEKAGCGRLDQELDRWSTASRSMIVAFGNRPLSEVLHRDRTVWPWRTVQNENAIVDGDPDELLLSDFLQYNPDHEYYSVKTGVTYVGRADEGKNGKDLLEANSLHAMYRSQLIDTLHRKYRSRMPATRYQLEILTVTIKRSATAWDGFQVRALPGAKRGEIWFPGTAIPNHGQPFCENYTGRSAPGYWQTFWQSSFAEALGRAKGEMLVYFGLQHMTANAQNMLVVFDRVPRGEGSRSSAITLRDVGDTCVNDSFFEILKTLADPGERKVFSDFWSQEEASAEHGVFLSKGAWGDYAPAMVTRTAAASCFFIPRFYETLPLPTDTEKRQLMLRWSVALNESFLDDMVQNIAYPPPGARQSRGYSYSFDDQLADYGTKKSQVWAELTQYADPGKFTKSEYSELVTKLRALSRPVRVNLLHDVMGEIERMLARPSTEELSEVDIRQWGGAHELLIGVEIDEWVGTPEGSAALKRQHGEA